MQPGRVVQLHHEPRFQHGAQTTGADFATALARLAARGEYGFMANVLEQRQRIVDA
jgi:hypothetical protein